jgi:hypothetical protein
MPPIVGRTLMKRLVADKNTFEEVSTISDEALALLGLENGVDRWDDIFKRCDGDVRPYAKGQEIPEAHKSTVPTKYTVASNPDANTEKDGHDKRWSKDGIIRFNQLRQMIIKDRAAHPEFVPKWLAQERDSLVSGPTASTTHESDIPDADDDYIGQSIRLPRAALKEASQQQDVVDHDSDHQPEDETEEEVEDDDNFGTGEGSTTV